MFKIIDFSLLFPLSQARVFSVAKGSLYCLKTNWLSHSRQYDRISQHCDSDITAPHCVPRTAQQSAGVSQHQTPGRAPVSCSGPFSARSSFLGKCSAPLQYSKEGGPGNTLAFWELSWNFIIPFSFIFLK